MVYARYGRAAAALILLLWAASLTLPAIHYCAVVPETVPQQHFEHGLKLLLVGWIGPAEGLFGWFANPSLLLVCFALFLRERPWPWLLWAPFLFSALAWLQGSFVRDFDAGEYRACAFGPGYWLWLAACTAPLLLDLAAWRARHGDQPLPD